MKEQRKAVPVQPDACSAIAAVVKVARLGPAQARQEP